MKQLLAAVLALLMLIMAGCAVSGKSGSATKTTTSAITTATAATTTAAPTATAAATTAAPTAVPTITYTSDTFHFALQLPASWEGAYATADTERGVVFYELQNHLYNARGKLFSIIFVEESEYHEGLYPAYVDMGVFDGKHAVWLDVTDVQYDPDLQAPYEAMMADLSVVRSTFAYTA